MRARVRRNFTQLKKGYMKSTLLRAAALAVVSLLLVTGGAFAAPTVQHIKPRPLPTPILPNYPLHTEFVVEVNHLGQIVRVKSGKECKYLPFNAMSYGNVLQMFIRRPDGGATVGVYRVSYDYDPKTKNVHRGIQLLSEGGTWANEEGAVIQMMRVNEKNRERHRGLPGLDQIIKPAPKATKAPH